MPSRLLAIGSHDNSFAGADVGSTVEFRKIALRHPIQSAAGGQKQLQNFRTNESPLPYPTKQCLLCLFLRCVAMGTIH
jgi:hypothetical protein